MATDTSARFWANMKDKAAGRLAAVTEDREPESEGEVKDDLECVIRHGTAHDLAEAIVESVEWQVSHMMCALHGETAETK